MIIFANNWCGSNDLQWIKAKYLLIFLTITEEHTKMQEIQRRLKNTWNSINNLRKQEKEAQEKHLESLMENTDDKQKKQVIQQMKFREHTRWQFRRIRNTLNQVKSGVLLGVDLPIFGEEGK